MSNIPYARQFIHSCYVKNPSIDSDAVVIKEYIYPTEETVTPEPNIRILQDPKRKFAVTKPVYRTYDHKKEWEDLAAVDWYTTYNKDMSKDIYRALHGKNPYGYVKYRQLTNSPYVYGSDIGIETLIKHNYTENLSRVGYKPVPPTVGMLDIETSVLSDGEEIIMITVTHEKHVYTAILSSFFQTIDRSGQSVSCSITELEHMSQSVLKECIDTYGFTFTYHVAETPQELIFWIWDRIHENHTDFIGVWNIDFDIPKIMKALEDEGIPPEDILSHPDVPKGYRHCYYRQDPTKDGHFSRKWHWLSTSGTAQFYDAMCLYSILRTHTDGLLPTYKLDAILKRHNFGGKLKFTSDIPDTDYMSNIDWHRYMQKNKPYEYIIYNQYDTISVQMLEWETSDVVAMYLLIGDSHLKDYTRQSRRSADVLHFECIKLNKVCSTVGESMIGPHDDLIPKKDGGTVLRPERTHDLGMKALKDLPHITTMLHPFTGDLDFSQMYPTVIISGNMSQETKKSTLIDIEGFRMEHVQTISSMLISPYENAVSIGSTYFGLPSYTDLLDAYKTERHGSS